MDIGTRPQVAPDRNERVRDLAAGQDGLVTREQALGLGLSRDQVHRRLSGSWQRLLPAVYATFTGPVQRRQLLRAALLFAGPGAALTGSTACRERGLRYLPDDDRLVHVLLAATCQVRSTSFVRVHRTTDMPPWHVRDGLPLVAVDRAAVDACRELATLREVRALLCEVVQRRLTTIERLERVLRDGASAGARLPRRALADLRAGCRSAPECEFRDLVGRSRVLPEPLWNQGVTLVGGERIPDARWPQARLVVEMDSREWHDMGEAVEETRRRHARLVAQGYTVLAVSPRRLREEPEVVLAEVEAAYLVSLSVAARQVRLQRTWRRMDQGASLPRA